MKKIAISLFLSAVVITSCSSSAHNIFSKKTPHEKHAGKQDDTPEGRAWVAASEKSLEQPYTIPVPYRQQGFFQPGRSRALGLAFTAKAGERIIFEVDKERLSGKLMYADIFRKNADADEPEISADPADSILIFDVTETGSYILRLQPELNYYPSYSLSISSGPSLGFPVRGSKARTGSFWGASRDGGKRTHEGIDIFAPKGTPVIASEDGYITGVRDGGIGGKTVWQRANGRNISLYYAHLDKQLVTEGQSVKKGDVIGLVGNTGNAKHTPAHLHFGVYTFMGPIDPFPFVNPSVKKAPALAEKELQGQLKLEKSMKIAGGTSLLANTLLVPLAVNAKGYLAETPDGNIMLVNFGNVKMWKYENVKM